MTTYGWVRRHNVYPGRIYPVVVALWLTVGLSPAQHPPRTSIESSSAKPATQDAYRLGPGDVVSVRALDAEEISGQPIRVGANGDIALPLVGRIRAAGLTTEQMERELVEKLRPLIRHPEVSVNVVELHSQPVSILGAVMTPGVHQLQGSKTLVEMLALAGGLRQDAGHGARITRRVEYGSIPLRGATPDISGRFSVAQVNLKGLVEGRDPESNIQIMPEDVISVPRAEMIYVIGEVRKSGGFTLGEQENISALKALSLAEGLSTTAAPQSARILRLLPGAPKRTDVPVDLKKILEGKHDDVQLVPEDILFIPGSKTKNVALRSLEAIVQIGTGVVIYRR